MTDITARLPAPLSQRLSAASSRITAKAGRAIDYALAGIPFLSAATSENPFVMQTADMRKDQFDQESEPGEQSLQGWWIRSQDSWHMGAGADFQEARGEVGVSSRYKDSSGIDPWTEGELKLLRRAAQATPATTEAACLFATSDALYLGVGAEVRSTTVGSGSATTLLGTAGGGETFTDLTVGKEAWYGVTNVGKVYTKPIVGGSLKNFPLTNADVTFHATQRLAWAKHRLFATHGRRVYVVDTTAASTTAMTPLYSHPTTDWSFTDIAEGPACVYLSGWSEAESCIQIVTIEDDGGVPTLTAGKTTAIMPRGERIERISVLAGTWIGIATDRGFRVGAVDVNGDIQYGPLFLEPDNCAEAKAITAWDRFFYVSWATTDSKCCVYRVDVSAQPDEDGSFAYAKDVEVTTSGAFTDLAVVEDGRVVAAFSAGAYPALSAAKYWYQHATELVTTGFVEFGGIRFRTTEPKLFKYVTIDLEPLAGSIEMDAVVNDSLLRFRVLNTQGVGEYEQAALPGSIGTLRALGLKFTLNRSVSDATAGPVIHSYSVKALPAVKPQRLIQLPLMCYDREQWTTGQRDGHDGFALDRLDALQAIEDSGELVLWQDFTSAQGSRGREVKIESVRYTQTSPPHSTQDNRNYGGVIELLLRTTD